MSFPSTPSPPPPIKVKNLLHLPRLLNNWKKTYFNMYLSEWTIWEDSKDRFYALTHQLSPYKRPLGIE